MSDETERIYRLLKMGVPPTAVARAFDLDPDMVKGLLSEIRVESYGTPASKARFIQLVLARSIGLAGKSTPETSEKIRAALEQMAADMSPTIQLQESIYSPSE